MEPLKIFDIGMLAFVFGIQALGGIALLFMLQGCASKDIVIDSMFYDQKPSYASIMVEKSPVRVVYTGPMTEHGLKFAQTIIRESINKPYRNYKFNDSFNEEVLAGFQRHEIDHDTNAISMTRNKGK